MQVTNASPLADTNTIYSNCAPCPPGCFLSRSRGVASQDKETDNIGADLHHPRSRTPGHNIFGGSFRTVC